jgi:autonomous glycyl radical cofactor GrcA
MGKKEREGEEREERQVRMEGGQELTVNTLKQ